MSSVFAMVKGSYQLPFAVMDGHGRGQPFGRVAVARHVGEHRFALEFLSFEGGGEIDAVDRVVRRKVDLQHAENGRIKIGRLDASVVARSRLSDAGPDYNAGHADASVVDVAFATEERRVAGDGSDVGLAVDVGLFEAAVLITTVVGGKENDSFVGDSLFVESVEESADGIVH